MIKTRLYRTLYDDTGAISSDQWVDDLKRHPKLTTTIT